MVAFFSNVRLFPNQNSFCWSVLFYPIDVIELTPDANALNNVHIVKDITQVSVHSDTKIIVKIYSNQYLK